MWMDDRWTKELRKDGCGWMIEGQRNKGWMDVDG